MSHNLHGEASDVDAQHVALACVQLPEIIRMYNLEDVFNFDETSMCYRASPAKIFEHWSTKRYEEEKTLHQFRAWREYIKERTIKTHFHLHYYSTKVLSKIL